MVDLIKIVSIVNQIYVLLKHFNSHKRELNICMSDNNIDYNLWEEIQSSDAAKEHINQLIREVGAKSYDNNKLGYFVYAVNEKIKEVEDSISVKSLRDKANTASELVDLKTIKQIDDLESSLHQEPTSHETSLINGCHYIGATSAFDIDNSKNEEATMLVEHADDFSKAYLFDYIILLLGRLAYLIELQSKFLHLSRYLDSLVKHVTSKARQFHYQTSSLFLALFHYIDIIHNLHKIIEFNNIKNNFINSIIFLKWQKISEI